MRIRRKKHLNERLDALKDYIIIPERDILDVNKAIEDKRYYDYTKIFSNDNPIELEIGCGKGGFITEKAKNNPNINYFAVEMMENIIVMAAENAIRNGVTNVRFINTGAEYLPRYFTPKSIQTIYLNFSPPYPKDSNENRRLSNARFISGYKKYLTDNGEIYLKTDDKGFFDYSVDSLVKNGFDVSVIDNAEERLKLKNGILTEYEKKFTEQDKEIYYLRARINEDI